jgi:DMSO/TMAO reductase YedYZ molybdopterin-dependent catalytic subunit
MTRTIMETEGKEPSVNRQACWRSLRAALGGLAVSAIALTSWGPAIGQGAPSEVEIREYQGEKLGSVADFRENSIDGVQVIDPDLYTLTVDGLVDAPIALSYADLQALPHEDRLVTIYCVEGWSVKALWTGIPLAALFDRVGPLAEVNTVIFYAADGYTTTLPLSVVLERNLILADHINGIVLPPANGFPFQLVAQDKWGYKWIRWVTRIQLSDDPLIEGYWESRGFSNNGEVGVTMYGD